MANNAQDDLTRALSDHAGRVETTVCLSHRVLLISEDRLELALKNGMERVTAKTAWAVPAGIFLSCILALVTSKAHNSFGVSAAVWQAILGILAIASAVWFAVTVIRCRSYTSQDFLNEIRGVSSRYSAADVSQLPAQQPLDSIERAAESTSLQTFPRNAVQMHALPTVTVSPVNVKSVVNPTNLTPSVLAKEPGMRPFGGIRPRTNVLQCRNCGFSIPGVTGRPRHCPRCGLIN
jgi:hypothetical protein